MKSMLLALAATTFIAAPAMASAAEPTQMTVDQVISYAQWMYPAQVVGVRYDLSQAENPHYHVDMMFTQRLVHFEVDAVTGRIAQVPNAMEQPRPRMSLLNAVERVKDQFEGDVIGAEFDATTRTDPHYHVDVKLSSGHVIPVRVEENGVLQWRQAGLTLAK